MAPLDFLQLLNKNRRTVRSFDPAFETADALLSQVKKAISIAGMAPSMGNFQPTKCFIATTMEQKKSLLFPCFDSHLIIPSSGIIAILSDKSAVYEYGKKVIEEDRASGAITDSERRAAELFFEMGFSKSPCGIGGLAKKFFLPALRFFCRVPDVPMENYRAWLSRQAGLFTSTLLMELANQKVDWAFVEHFDQKRFLKALSLKSSRYYVQFVIAYGRAKERAGHERFCCDIDDILCTS